jgi:hypothetical protein
MADQEIIKHVKSAIETSRDHNKKWPQKLREILLEIAIIVFAVSLSIWLHNWSEDRKDRQEEREFLAGLKQDLETDIREMNTDIAVYQDEVIAIHYFERVGMGEALNKDSLGAYLNRLFTTTQLAPEISRFEALKGSGRMSIIRNKELLLNITDLYAKGFPYIIQTNSFINSLRQNNLTPFLYAHLQLDPHAPIKGTNWQEVFQMPQMRMIVFEQESIRNNIAYYQEAIGKCRKIISQIEEELR